jgi:parvulin-like peptidyl-prolyl isomerase
MKDDPSMKVTACALMVHLAVGFLADPAAVVMTVNGTSVRQSDWEFRRVWHGWGNPVTEEQRRQISDELIDRVLLRAFLREQSTGFPTAEQLTVRRTMLWDLLREQGHEPEAYLASLGISAQQVEQELALPLAWSRYARPRIKESDLDQRFRARAREFDGTRMKLAHIVRVASAAEDRKAARQQLQQVRREIVEKQCTFEEAARRSSQSPSRNEGGVVGWVSGRGKLVDEVYEAALELPVGEVSEVVESSVGVHLVTVLELEPGDLTLDDVRPVVWQQLSEELQQSLLRELRISAKIELKPLSP